jgi:hypothetical protein
VGGDPQAELNKRVDDKDTDLDGFFTVPIPINFIDDEIGAALATAN